MDCGAPVLMGWHRRKSGGGRVMDDGKVRDRLDKLEEEGVEEGHS